MAHIAVGRLMLHTSEKDINCTIVEFGAKALSSCQVMCTYPRLNNVEGKIHIKVTIN